MERESTEADITNSSSVDILMITHNFPEYVERTIPVLLEACDEHCRVWLWHNGTDEETLEVARRFADDGRVHKFHHSVDNVRLTKPTNWLWSQSNADFVSKVDDDCLLPTDWIRQIRLVHAAYEGFGAVGCSRIRPEDRDEVRIQSKLQTFNGAEILRNHWVQGSGYLLKRRWVESGGLLKDGQSWTEYCLELALSGAVNGFAYPLIFEDHLDDPRSENTGLKSDADLWRRAPLSLQRNRVDSLADWERRMIRSSTGVQTAPIDLQHWRGWRRRFRNLKSKIMKLRRP